MKVCTFVQCIYVWNVRAYCALYARTRTHIPIKFINLLGNQFFHLVYFRWKTRSKSDIAIYRARCSLATVSKHVRVCYACRCCTFHFNETPDRDGFFMFFSIQTYLQLDFTLEKNHIPSVFFSRNIFSVNVFLDIIIYFNYVFNHIFLAYVHIYVYNKYMYLYIFQIFEYKYIEKKEIKLCCDFKYNSIFCTILLYFINYSQIE